MAHSGQDAARRAEQLVAAAGTRTPWRPDDACGFPGHRRPWGRIYLARSSGRQAGSAAIPSPTPAAPIRATRPRRARPPGRSRR